MNSVVERGGERSGGAWKPWLSTASLVVPRANAIQAPLMVFFGYKTSHEALIISAREMTDKERLHAKK